MTASFIAPSVDEIIAKLGAQSTYGLSTDTEDLVVSIHRLLRA